MDKAICTVSDAVNWLGDRGVEARANNIRVRGRWALVRELWSVKDNEVDCYDLASGSMYAEPWDAIKYTDSPFIPDNKDATEKALATMEQEYQRDEVLNDWLDQFKPEDIIGTNLKDWPSDIEEYLLDRSYSWCDICKTIAKVSTLRWLQICRDCEVDS